MRVRVKIRAGEIIFSSEMAKRAFFERNDKQEAIIDIDDNPSANSRRYFEGALIPAVYYQHPNSGWVDFGDAREALKLEFIPAYTHSLEGQRVKVARSTAELSKSAFLKLLEAITAWLEENQMEVPNPDDYKIWRDSAPPAGEIYPPLARMKVAYDKARLKTQEKVDDDKPWRKKPNLR